MRCTRFATYFLPSIVLFALAGCGGGGSGSSSSTLSGTVQFLAASFAVAQEPNDTLDQTQNLGRLPAGATVVVRGNGGADLFDAFHWSVPEGVRVRAAVDRGELAVFDPVEQRFVARGSKLEFDAHGSFELVLRKDAGAYALRVHAERSDAFDLPAASERGIHAAQAFDPSNDGPRFEAFLHPALEARSGELILATHADVDSAPLLAAHGLRETSRIPDGPRLVEFDLPANLDDAGRARRTLATVRALAEDPRVEYAELDLVRRKSSVSNPTPNDPYYHLQWHYSLIHVPEAWGITTGSDAIIVAVIDTGESNHPDLVSRQIAGYDFISSVASAGDGNGIDSDPTDVGDGNGVEPNSFHGTHVAGTIGAATDNSLGVSGITWAGKIMHLRVLGKQGGTDFDIANAIRYAARLSNNSSTLPPQRANVINMSLGGPGSSSTMQNAITAARNAGVVIFAAAGNENSSAPSYPAAYNGVVSVAAVGFNAQRAPYSNFGPTIDLCAPGGDTSVDLNGDGFGDGVLSTLMQGTTLPFSPIYAFYQGTSMATPHAAGVAALMLAANPALTPTQIENILETTATDLGAPGRDDLYGYGLINAYQAVYVAQNGAPPLTPVLGVSPLDLGFGKTQTNLSAPVNNLGGGLLSVGVLSVATVDGHTWLSAVSVPSTSSSSDTASITVTVDRTGLVDGHYTGTVSVPSNGGSAVIDVAMTVDSTPVIPNVTIYVLLVDSHSFATVAQTTVNPTTTLAYSFPPVAAGSYTIVAGSDDNNDGTIGGAGDTYFGLYPSVDQPASVMASGTNIGGLDFPVTAQVAPSVHSGGNEPRRVFPILRPPN